MKKFLSLLLAALMLFSCTAALAEDTQHDPKESIDNTVNTTHDDWAEDGKTTPRELAADIRAYDSVKYSDGDANQFDTKAELGTELWMQVTADGQIDVTVPLVLVFQTNIDGGDAETGDRYQILNNNNADVVVTKIEFAKTELGDDPQNGVLMEMVEYDVDEDGHLKKDLQQNQYMAQLSVESRERDEAMKEETAVLGLGTYLNGDLVELENDNHTKMDVADHDADTAAKYTEVNEGEYDMYMSIFAKDAKEGGLFKLNRADEKVDENGEDADPTATHINVDMKTGRLTFVTETTGTGDDEELNTEKGVHLLTATYTVAIDSSNQYGYDIKGANAYELTEADNDNPVVIAQNNGNHTATIVDGTTDTHNEIDDTSRNK